MDSLIEKASNPFFIVSPAYTRASAGINALYILCHYLNLAGERGFIVDYPPARSAFLQPRSGSPEPTAEYPGNFIAPRLTQDIIDFYHHRHITPVVIYPEIFDNPLNAPFFGRYILNYPGKASVSGYAQIEDFAFAYSRILATHCTDQYPDRAAVDDVLFIPTMDLDFWKKHGGAAVRRGTCFYAGKMRRVHGTTPENVPEGSVELHNSVRMTQVDIRRLFWRSEAFYCYEDSALAIEAQLCGCPTVFVPNTLFSGTPLASIELGWDGSCVTGEALGLERARRTVACVEPVVRGLMEQAPGRIAELGRKWKAQAARREYRGTIDLPFEPRFVVVPKVTTNPNDHANAECAAPLASLDRQTMREIAREVWHEKNRLGLSYRTMRFLKTRLRPKRVVPGPAFARVHLSQTAKAVPCRIVLFAHFDRDGLIDDYVLHYLRGLQSISARILFMSDCDLRDGEAEKLSGLAELVFAAPHGEYDFGSWKRGFEALNYDLSGWDELIIANDSCYAPLFSLERAFDLIGECDFWGATKEPYSRLATYIAMWRAERTDKKRQACCDVRAEEDFDFLNSYFMVFKKPVLGDPAFTDFWRKVERQADKERVIELYEMGLTKLLVSSGYKFACFAVRAGVVAYKKFEVPVPDGFHLPWLRVLICRKNEELVEDLDKQLDRIDYPRSLIDHHIERMTGTARPPHYFLRLKNSVFPDINLGTLWRARSRVTAERR